MVSVSQKPHTLYRPASRFQGEVPIKNLGKSNFLYKIFSHTADLQIAKFNLSLNDWASKICIFFALDIPQSYIAFKKDAHKWETTSRNVIVTITGLLFTIFTKADKYSLNGFLNIFMKPQYKPGEFPSGPRGLLAKLINPLRPKTNYYKIFEYLDEPLSDKPKKKTPGFFVKLKQEVYETLGIKPNANAPGFFAKLKQKAYETMGISLSNKGASKAHWASLDSNYLEEIEKLGKKLEKTAVTELEKELKTTIPAFLWRYKLFSVLATLFVSAFTIYLIGELALKAAFKFFAPWDHDWSPEGDLNKSKQVDSSSNPLETKTVKTHHLLPAPFVPYLPYARTIQNYPPLLASTQGYTPQLLPGPSPFLSAGTLHLTHSIPTPQNPFMMRPVLPVSYNPGGQRSW